MADTAHQPTTSRSWSRSTRTCSTTASASIKLVKLEWGAVAVNGSTATATTYETWTTTFSDGTTEQSRDRNDYSLVLDNGALEDQRPTRIP